MHADGQHAFSEGDAEGDEVEDVPPLPSIASLDAYAKAVPLGWRDLSPASTSSAISAWLRDGGVLQDLPREACLAAVNLLQQQGQSAAELAGVPIHSCLTRCAALLEQQHLATDGDDLYAVLHAILAAAFLSSQVVLLTSAASDTQDKHQAQRVQAIRTAGFRCLKAAAAQAHRGVAGWASGLELHKSIGEVRRCAAVSNSCW